MKSSADLDKNNLDCLRLILASIVALFHICALTNIPAFSAFGKYLSPHFAIRGFFVISGLLIYRSYTRSSTARSYFEKRIRRIYPAYFTVIVLAAIALFTLSTLHADQYFGGGFWKYLGANLIFLNFLAPSLPGVFMSNPVSPVNGALWTLKIEVAFYIFVPLLHYLCSRLGTRKVMATIFFSSCIWKYGFAYLAALDYSRHPSLQAGARSIYSQLEVQFPAQLVYFSAGILLLLYFDTLKRHFGLISCMAACFFLIDHFYTGDALDVLWISGVVFVFGFWHYLGNFSKHGDLSYGVYIVHWPILQTLITIGALRLGAPSFLLISLFLIVVCSALMWNFVERRFLTRSSHFRQVSASPGI